MEKHAIQRTLSSYMLTSSTVATAEIVPIDQETMLPSSPTATDAIERTWVQLEGRDAPAFAKRFPVDFSPGDVVHVVQMVDGVTAKPNRPALVMNATKGKEHVERLSPPTAGPFGIVFGPVGAWLVVLVLACLIAAKAGDHGLGAIGVTALVVLAAAIGVYWGYRCVTEIAYVSRSRARAAEEASAIAEARRIIAGETSDA